jgi:hypothetical protein
VGPELINKIDQEISDLEKDLDQDINEIQGMLNEIENEM